MSDDLEQRAHRAAGTFLVVVGAILTAVVPVFAFTYTQPDMGFIVVVGGVLFLWMMIILVGSLAIAFGTARWQRIAGIVIAVAPAAELIVFIVTDSLKLIAL